VFLFGIASQQPVLVVGAKCLETASCASRGMLNFGASVQSHDGAATEVVPGLRRGEGGGGGGQSGGRYRRHLQHVTNAIKAMTSEGKGKHCNQLSRVCRGTGLSQDAPLRSKDPADVLTTTASCPRTNMTAGQGAA
jgi:hypothetical protein